MATTTHEPTVPMKADGSYDPADVRPGVFRVGDSDRYLHAFPKPGGEPGELNIRELKRVKSGTFYKQDTPQAVVDAFESELRRGLDERREVRVFYGDARTGRDWLEENDTVGVIGRTMGGNGPIPLKEPILLASAEADGGGGVLTDCIVRLQVNGKEVYRHPSYHHGEITFAPSRHAELPHGAFVNGQNHANFETALARDVWAAFIKGDRRHPEPTLPEALSALEAMEARMRALETSLSQAHGPASVAAPAPAQEQAASPDPSGPKKGPKRGGPAP